MLVFASHNAGKIRDVREVLGMSFLSLSDLGITVDIEETGSTFKEKALIKARAISGLLNCPVLADDSGLEIGYLNGEPGGTYR